MRIHNTILAVVMFAIVLPYAAGCTGARCADCGKTIKIDRLEGVHFDFDRYVIKPAGMRILNEDVALLKERVPQGTPGGIARPSLLRVPCGTRSYATSRSSPARTRRA